MNNTFLPFKVIAGLFLLVPAIALCFVPQKDRLRPDVAFPFLMVIILGVFMAGLITYYITSQNKNADNY